LLLGKGWYEAWWDIDLEETQRGMQPESIIKIINPREEETEFSMKIKLMGYKQSRNIEIFFNGEYLYEENIPLTPITLELNKLQLIPGENILSIKSDGYEVWVNENDNMLEKTSLIGFGISEK